MMRYSIESKDRIFVKNNEFLSVANNMGKNIGKNIIKNISGKYSQKILDSAKQSATDVFKIASKRALQKTADTTGDMIGNKTDDIITKFSRNSPKNSSGTVTNGTENIVLDRETPKKK